MPGPLPQAQHRHRATPSIPTTVLPPGGREGSTPKPPKWIALGVSGSAWWAWAWHTPQAAGWASGHEVVVARRAMLEDDLAALDSVEGLDFGDLPEGDIRTLRAVIGRVAALATGRLQLMKEMRELDDRLGLTPKSMAQLRWTISDDEPQVEPSADGVVVVPDRWRLGAG